MISAENFAGRRFIVTGGEGFIGSHIVDFLVGSGADVIVVDDLSNGQSRLGRSLYGRMKVFHENIETFSFETVGRVDCVFHEAARALIPSFKDPVTDMRVNVGGTIRVLEYARRYDVKVVHASSGSIYGNPVNIPISEDHPLNPISPYGTSKLAAENYCSLYHRTYGVDVVMLRYFNVYGPRQSVSEEMGVIPIFTHRALSKEPLTIFGDGEQTRDFLNVRDVVKANMLAYITKDISGEAINIGGGGHEISIINLAHLILKLCSSVVGINFKEPKPGDIRRLVADNSKARKLIGYQPSITLEDGLREYIDYVQQEKT